MPHRILIVDDSEMIRMSLSGLLRDNGYEVSTARDGLECVQLMSSREFDLVMMDIVMPGVSGIEMLRTIKEKHDTEVIMISAYADKDKAIAALRLNAYDFVEKPFESKEILNTITHCLNLLKMRKDLERKSAELAAAEEKYRDLYENAPDMYQSIDKNGYIIEVNLTEADALGYSKEELLGRHFTELLSDDSKKEFERDFPVLLKKGSLYGLERQLIRKDGSVIDVTINVTVIYDEKGEPVKTRAIIRDITEKKIMEDNLVLEKERLLVTLHSIGDAVIATDSAGKVLLINKVGEELTGWRQEEACGRPLTEVFYIINEKTREIPEDPVTKVLRTGLIVGLANHTALIAKDGTVRIIADSGSPIKDRNGRIIGVVLVFRDITKLRKMEEEFQKANKLDSIGILAGGIAHDFNNILTGIIGNISLAKMLKNQEQISSRLIEAEKACLRAKALTEQLLTFSKGGMPIKKAASITEVLKDAAGFTLSGSNISCEFCIPDNISPVDIDEGQINQVIHNLIINAQQAMPLGGKIKIKAENITVDGDIEEQSLPLDAGKYVKITVQDHGIGIPDEHIDKIFDPYFTTKQQGNGLGLATAYSIVRNHDGLITVESKVSSGATFNIYLPCSNEEVIIKKRTEESITAGRGKVLVMDDEETVRSVAGEMLKVIGYEACFARDGLEAINLYRKAQEIGEPFNAVIMDLTIAGGMGGEEAVQRLLEIDPNVKAIVSSGYSNDPIMADFKKYGFCDVIAKPYEVRELSRTLNKVINAGRDEK